jgi:DNA-binding XRE family transcriptional regulator
MPPAQVQELVAQVKAWYETHEMLQRDLAAKLGVSPTGLSNIFSGANQPSAATALAMIQFLEENQNMKSIRVDPPKFPKPSTRDPSVPLTLASAKEMLAARDAEIAALRRAAASPGKPLVPVLQKTKAQPAVGDPGADPIFPSITTPGGNQPNKNPMAANFEAPPLALLPPDADCPARIQKYLDAMTEAEVRDCLRGEHDPLRLGMTYKELQKRKTLTAIG